MRARRPQHCDSSPPDGRPSAAASSVAPPDPRCRGAGYPGTRPVARTRPVLGRFAKERAIRASASTTATAPPAPTSAPAARAQISRSRRNSSRDASASASARCVTPSAESRTARIAAPVRTRPAPAAASPRAAACRTRSRCAELPARLRNSVSKPSTLCPTSGEPPRNSSSAGATDQNGGAERTASSVIPVNVTTARRDRSPRVYQRLKSVDDAVSIEPHGADLDDLVGLQIETGRLQVQRDVSGAQLAVILSSAAAGCIERLL